MKVKLDYGRNDLIVDLPENTCIISARFMPGLPDEASSIREALRRPIGSPPLSALFKPGDKVVISHTDITRATPNKQLLTALLNELKAAGVSPQDITLLAIPLKTPLENLKAISRKVKADD